MDLALIADWFDEHSTALIWATALSIVFVIATLIAVPVAIVRIPADYFKQNRRQRRGTLAGRIARNIVGYLLIAAGIAMLVLPGQGVMVIIIGVALADFPGKYRLQRWLITRGRILRVANRLRARFHKPPLELDGAAPARAPVPA